MQVLGAGSYRDDMGIYYRSSGLLRTVCGEWGFSSFWYLTDTLCNAMVLSVSQNYPGWLVLHERAGDQHQAADPAC